MKIFIFIAFVAFFAIANGVFVPPRPGHKKHNLGSERCTWGPSYWCQNLTSAAGCHATKHCIQTVWIHKQLPPDDSSVCQTCLDMVKQARDQLESNETQDMIKQVFEGSCALIHLKLIVKECDKIVDQYIPDLIDTLASQMNPQVVCSVAGLCNNEKVHQLLAEQGEIVNEKRVAVVDAPDKCEGCHTVVDILESRFNKMSKDDVLHSLLGFCGQLGSFSDGCSNIIITYFNKIYSHLQNHLNSNEVCLMSGECSAQFHTHAAKVEITPMSHIGYVSVNKDKDDLPCDLCEQLVQHLRELLIANTTEAEFKRVLEGLCKQTGDFANECVALVGQYYAPVYDFLVNELNSTNACKAIGICPSSDKEVALIAPLLPSQSADLALSLSSHTDKPLVNIPPALPELTADNQLPIDRLMPPHTQVLYNKEVCEFCQYFLHYLQVAITDPKTEEKIKEVVDEACGKLPSVVNSTCLNFIDNYEPALVAILAQEIDPSQICPLIRACPSSDNKDVEIFMEAKSDSKCPLCLIAVTKLENLVKDNKTEESIKSALKQVCTHLPNNLVAECSDLVDAYSKELVELLMADLKPDEVCVYLKLCKDEQPADPLPPYVFRLTAGNIETNVIPDNTINGQVVGSDDGISQQKPTCVICEFIMKEIEDQLKDKKTDADIEQIVRHICNIMPKSIKTQCNGFIDDYADTIIQALIAALEPSEICSMMKLCTSQFETIRVEILECPICQMTVEAMKKILANPKVDHDIEHVLEKTCRGLPHQYRNKCKKMIEKHGKQMIDLLIKHASVHKICKEMEFCSTRFEESHLVGVDHCTYGPSYWCESEENAEECDARQHCETKVWNSKTKRELLGANPCTRGPAYWCDSEENANKCNARAHCESKVWNQHRSKRELLVGSNPCTRGPAHWCASEGNANKCDARSYCESKVWNQQRSKRELLVGSNPCTRGPAYWCASEENANKCNARSHCESRVWNQQRSKRGLLGSNPCTRGPAYWCESEENANKCNARAHCESKVWNQQRSKRELLVGSNPCTRGPAYWCASEENANKCNARSHCESRVWNQQRSKRGLLGSNPCTRGPAYWCESEENANKCNARAHCESKVWNQQRSKRELLVGSNPCTRGPAYWCASEENANKCNARSHCESRVWNQQRSKRGLLGSNPCTRGPAYWCESEENANKCNARAHCESKVWNQQRSKRELLVGSNPCTRGPAHWCASEGNANKCDARSYCESRVWNQQRSKRGLLGSNPCTRGPAYWCESEENANKCNAKTHCQTRVWNQK
ncbi:unnamed protein product [Phaedon cochleariae]|uniref:Prosaposin n=1 Tax=Phaedon cochleariae TaxID=80249 RepID=A0A9P0DY00_PHACE|nr:unnamed protein product [Phaedon cochleariae]